LEILESKLASNDGIWTAQGQIDRLVGGVAMDFRGGLVENQSDMKFLPVALAVKEYAPVEFQPVGEIAEAEVSVDVQLIARLGDQSLRRRAVGIQLRHRLLDAGADFAIARPFTMIVHAEGRRIGCAQYFPPDQIKGNGNVAALLAVFHPPEEHVHGCPENRDGQEC
jgi:hypothetical protein